MLVDASALKLRLLLIMLNAHKQHQKVFGREAPCYLGRGKHRVWSSPAYLCPGSLQGSNRILFTGRINHCRFFLLVFLLVFLLNCSSVICRSFMEPEL